jgi:membrane protease YdiL (CAAX protease family)
MPSSPTPADHAVVALSVLMSVVHSRWAYPAAARRISAGARLARLALYAYLVLVAWAFVALVAALWRAHARPWSTLGLGAGAPWRLAAGGALAALYVGLAVAQRRAVLARPAVLARLTPQFLEVAPLMPRTRAERWGFRALSVTAGVCEELFYRGFVTWYLGALAGPAAALLGAALLFGVDHAYLGRKHVARTGLVGLAFGLVTLLVGSLWPVMIIHAAADLVSGDLGARVLAGAASSTLGSAPVRAA